MTADIDDVKARGDFALKGGAGRETDLNISVMKRNIFEMSQLSRKSKDEQVISTRASVEEICQCIFYNAIITYQESRDNYLEKTPNNYFQRLLKKSNLSSETGWTWEIVSIEPTVEHLIARTWAVFKIDVYGGVWLFYRHTNSGYQRVHVPEEIKVGADGGIHIPKVGSYEPFKHPWPWPLFNYSAPAYQALDEMLKRNDGNFLTMLIEAQQPYRGIGRGLVAKIAEIRKMVLEGLPADPLKDPKEK